MLWSWTKGFHSVSGEHERYTMVFTLFFIAAPRFTTPPRSQRSRESGIVEFTCIAAGHPYPEYTWWNDNRIVNSESRITVSNGGQHLRIQELKLYDAGDYVCRAENRLGRAESKVSLEVELLPKPLNFVHQPHDMEAPKGTTVQLPCKANGSPKPRIFWMKDGQTISMDESSDETERRHHRLTPSGSLIMFNVSDADEGVYECVAENGRERRTAKATFHIKGECTYDDELAPHFWFLDFLLQCRRLRCRQ
jgi:peroxidase